MRSGSCRSSELLGSLFALAITGAPVVDARAQQSPEDASPHPRSSDDAIASDEPTSATSPSDDVASPGASAMEAPTRHGSDTDTDADADPALAMLLEALQLVRPTLLGELDYRVLSHHELGETGFALARLRTGLVVTPTSWLTAVATVEWAGGPTLIDAFVTASALSWLDVTVGYSRPPLFASFRHEPVHLLAFADYPMVVRSFFVQRDLGLEVHARPEALPLEAIVRVGNGSGSVLGNDNALPAGYASLDLVLGRAWRGAGAGERELGLRLGVGGLVESVRDRDGAQITEPYGFVSYRSAIVSGLRVVGEAHLIGYAGPVRLVVEGAFAREERSRDDDGNPDTPRRALPTMLSSGLHAELAWVVLGQARSVGVGPGMAADVGGQWSGGALELAIRAEALWLGHDAPDVAPGDVLGGALALRWFPTEFLSASVTSHAQRYAVAPHDLPTDLWTWDVALRLSVFWGQAPVALRS